MEYYDTDTIFYEEQRSQVKLYLNNLYEKMASCIHFTDGKECNKMSKDYIFIHAEKQPTIIFKKQIVSISKTGDKALIQCTNNECYYAEESYASIVKQLV